MNQHGTEFDREMNLYPLTLRSIIYHADNFIFHKTWQIHIKFVEYMSF